MARQLFTSASDTQFALSGKAFIGGDFSPAVAATNSHVQLFNPAASGIQVLINRILVRPSSSTPTIRLTSTTTALTTLSTFAGNKLIGGAAPVAEVRIQNNNGILGTVILFFRSAGTVEAEFLNLNPEIVLNPGNGVNIVMATQNEATVADFEWVEIPN